MLDDNQEQKKKGLLESEIVVGRINLMQKAMLAKHLAVMLKSGLNIAEALDISMNQATGKFKKILSSILKSVESGNTLSGSFAKYPRVFSSLYINTTLAGESSGNLEQNLDNIAEHLKKDYELINKIKAAMLYPIIVLIGAFVLGLAMAFLVVPKIVPLFEGLKMDLPVTTRIMIDFSHFIQKNGMVLIIGIILFFIFIGWFVRQNFSKPLTHFFLLNFPIIKNITRNTNLASFCRTLATLLKSGLHIDESLDITKDTVSNYYFKKALGKVNQRVSQGTKLSDNLEEYNNLFPKLTISMVRVGEKTGNLEETLFQLADFYETEVDLATKSLSTAIEPILLIFIGLFVGGLAYSIIGPIYKITGSVSK
jgi:type II secretory pathway component PulF